jgi:hypothetical protein
MKSEIRKFLWEEGKDHGTGGRSEVGWRRCRRMSIVQIMYIHVCKCKNDTC